MKFCFLILLFLQRQSENTNQILAMRNKYFILFWLRKQNFRYSKTNQTIFGHVKNSHWLEPYQKGKKHYINIMTAPIPQNNEKSNKYTIHKFSAKIIIVQWFFSIWNIITDANRDPGNRTQCFSSLVRTKHLKNILAYDSNRLFVFATSFCGNGPINKPSSLKVELTKKKKSN